MNKLIFTMSILLVSCYYTSDLDNLKEGVNYTINAKKNGISSLCYIKDGAITNQSYQFYNNGLIKSVSLISDSSNFTYNYNRRGQLICNVTSINKSHIKKMIYYSADSTLKMVATETHILLLRGSNKLDSIKVENKHINIGNFSIEYLNGKFMIYKFNYEKDDYEVYYVRYWF